MISIQIRERVTICLLLGLLLLCTPLLRAEDLPAGAPVTSTEARAAEEGVEGLAAFYAKRYNNRRTTSGQRYNPKKMTAAHPTLPLGSRVKVVNLANGREVIVTVNDRCRPKSKPFIDLSRAAAIQLGFLSKRTARVRIIPIDEEAKADTPAPTLASSALEQDLAGKEQ